MAEEKAGRPSVSSKMKFDAQVRELVELAAEASVFENTIAAADLARARRALEELCNEIAGDGQAQGWDIAGLQRRLQSIACRIDDALYMSGTNRFGARSVADQRAAIFALITALEIGITPPSRQHKA